MNTTSTHRNGLVWLTILVVGGVFYVTEHDTTTSLHDAFTQTADEMEVTATGGDFVRRIAYPSLGLFGVLFLATAPFNGSTDELIDRVRRLDWLLLLPIVAYLTWCGASILWSHEPGMTLRRLVVLWCVVIAGVGAARRLRPADLLLVGVVVPAVYLVIGVFAELRLGTFRPWSGDYRFSGTLHPNTQGINLACLCLSAAGLMQSRKRWRPLLLGVLACGFLFVLLTKSRTSAAGVLVALAALWTITTPLRTKLVLGFSGAWCVVAIIFGMLVAGSDPGASAADAALLGREEQAESLTGRLPIWTELSRFVAARPLLGYGYDSFWNPEHIVIVSEELQWGIREAHSTFVDGILSVGLIGLAFVVFGTFIGMWRCQTLYATTRNPMYGTLLGMCVFGLINACTESAMLVPAPYTFVLGTGLLLASARAGTESIVDESKAVRVAPRPSTAPNARLASTPSPITTRNPML